MCDRKRIPRATRNQNLSARACRWYGWAPFLLALLVLGGLAPRNAVAQPRVNNVVYVESNDPAGNAILAYSRDAVGHLTPLPGSPFPTGGLGLTPTFELGPFDSDQEVILNPSHSMLFAVNGGSNSISVFRINQDGSLLAVPGSPFPSGGSGPVSVGLASSFLCVVNQAEDPGSAGLTLPNYTSQRLSLLGQLTPVPNSTITVSVGSSPSQALISPDATLVFGADFLGGVLRSFKISSAGRLSIAAAQTLPPSVFAGTGAPPLPLGLAVHPSQKLLYVGFVTINQIGVYNYDDSGNLSFVRAVPDSGHGVCWLLVNKNGTRLYASNTGDPSVSVYNIQNFATMPVEIQRVNMMSTGGGFQFALDSSGRFLHVVTQQSAPTSTPAANALHVFEVFPDGTLREVPSSPTVLPVPNLVRPQGVAAL